jgi:hypothetical protein
MTHGDARDHETPGGMPQPRTDAADTGTDDGFETAVPDSAEGMLHVPGGASGGETGSQPGAAIPRGTDERTGSAPGPAGDGRDDPPSSAVPGRHDAGARGRDRDSGGWGDRGIGGGRAGGTGL